MTEAPLPLTVAHMEVQMSTDSVPLPSQAELEHAIKEHLRDRRVHDTSLVRYALLIAAAVVALGGLGAALWLAAQAHANPALYEAPRRSYYGLSLTISILGFLALLVLLLAAHLRRRDERHERMFMVKMKGLADAIMAEIQAIRERQVDLESDVASLITGRQKPDDRSRLRLRPSRPDDFN